MRRLLTLLALLFGMAPAFADTLGTIDIGTNVSGALRPNYKRASKFTMGIPGALTRMCAYLDGMGTVPNGPLGTHQALRLVVYRDAGGVPGTLAAQTDLLFVFALDQAQWRCAELPPTPLPAGDYWLGIHSGLNEQSSGPARYFYNNGPYYAGNEDILGDGASMSFGTPSTGTGTISIYAEYSLTNKITTAGTTTVGSSQSGGLRADFKRGSSFTMTSPGRVLSLNAYLDTRGGGGNGADQAMRLALYKDVNGVPTEKVLESSERVFSYNLTVANWYSFATPNVTLPAGKYWLMLHTGQPSGLIRYSFAGTGNWYGNADTYADGASNPFGAGSAGDGTVSAYVAYEPGNFSTWKFGNYTIDAATPTAPLAANFYYGSEFPQMDSTAALTDLYAYLDGLGANTGSQQLRMAVYYTTPSGGGPNKPWSLAWQSDVVTIPAGAQPGWVRFPVNDALISPGSYWITVNAGNTSGIVRLYGNGPPDTHSCADAFADGPDDHPCNGNDGTYGNVTLKIYGEYSRK